MPESFAERQAQRLADYSEGFETGKRAALAATPSPAPELIDSPETGWPSRIINGRHVPCANDGRVHPSVLAPSPAPAAAPADLRDAYEGAREDLLDWKRRALEAEALNRQFIAELNGPTFMGEPAPSAPVEAVAEVHCTVDAVPGLTTFGVIRLIAPRLEAGTPLYTAPPPAEAVRVLTPTDEEITAAHEAWQRGNPANPASSFARDEHGQFRSMFMHSMESAFKAGVRWLATPSAAAGSPHEHDRRKTAPPSRRPGRSRPRPQAGVRQQGKFSPPA